MFLSMWPGVLLWLHVACALKDIRLQPSLNKLPSPLHDHAQVYNPSIIKYNDAFIASFRHTNVSRRGNIEWWSNTAVVCTSQRLDFSAARCSVFQPFGPSRTECIWTDGKEGTETTGVEDVKLFDWPGRGVYAIFGAKPEEPAGARCPGPIVFQQYLQQIRSSSATKAGSSAAPGTAALPRQGPPVPLSITIEPGMYPSTGCSAASPCGSSFGSPSQLQVKEKNWMPFGEANKLYVVHSLSPMTRVYQLDPSSGKSVAGYTTSAESLFAKNGLPADKLHGGPPLALVTVSQSVQQRLRLPGGNPGSAQQLRRYRYYLGVLHYYDLELATLTYTYHHYFFIMQPKPPFRICAVSREIPLQPVPTAQLQKRNVQYVSGLYYDRGNGTVEVSYGAGDMQARVTVMGLAEVEGMFGGQVDRCWRPRCGRNNRQDPAGCKGNATARV